MKQDINDGNKTKKKTDAREKQIMEFKKIKYSRSVIADDGQGR